MNNKNIAAILSGVSIVKVAGAAVGFLCHIVIARTVGVEKYGVYILIWSIMVLLSLLSRAGFDNLLVREIGSIRNTSEKKRQEVNSLISSAKRSAAINSVMLTIVWLAIAFMLQKEPNKFPEICIGAAILPAFSLLVINQSIIRGAKKVIWASIPELLIKNGILVLLIFALKIVYADVDLIKILMATLFAVSIALIVTEIIISDFRKKQELKNIDSKFNLKWGIHALPFLIISGSSVMLRRADIVILGAFVSESQVGLYGASSRLTTLISFGLIIVNMSFSPYFSDLAYREKKEELKNLVSKIAKIVFALSLTTSVALIVFGKTILSLFGGQFVDAYPILVVLILGYSIGSITGPSAVLLIMAGEQKIASKIEMVAAFANIALNFWLIIKYGAIGAAIATSTVMIARNILYVYLAIRRIGVNTTIFAKRKKVE